MVVIAIITGALFLVPFLFAGISLFLAFRVSRGRGPRFRAEPRVLYRVLVVAFTGVLSLAVGTLQIVDATRSGKNGELEVEREIVVALLRFTLGMGVAYLYAGIRPTVIPGFDIVRFNVAFIVLLVIAVVLSILGAVISPRMWPQFLAPVVVLLTAILPIPILFPLLKTPSIASTSPRKRTSILPIITRVHKPKPVTRVTWISVAIAQGLSVAACVFRLHAPSAVDPVLFGAFEAWIVMGWTMAVVLAVHAYTPNAGILSPLASPSKSNHTRGLSSGTHCTTEDFHNLRDPFASPVVVSVGNLGVFPDETISSSRPKSKLGFSGSVYDPPGTSPPLSSPPIDHDLLVVNTRKAQRDSNLSKASSRSRTSRAEDFLHSDPYSVHPYQMSIQNSSTSQTNLRSHPSQSSLPHGPIDANHSRTNLLQQYSDFSFYSSAGAAQSTPTKLLPQEKQKLRAKKGRPPALSTGHPMGELPPTPPGTFLLSYKSYEGHPMPKLSHSLPASPITPSLQTPLPVHHSFLPSASHFDSNKYSPASELFPRASVSLDHEEAMLSQLLLHTLNLEDSADGKASRTATRTRHSSSPAPSPVLATFNVEHEQPSSEAIHTAYRHLPQKASPKKGGTRPRASSMAVVESELNSSSMQLTPIKGGRVKAVVRDSTMSSGTTLCESPNSTWASLPPESPRKTKTSKGVD